MMKLTYREFYRRHLPHWQPANATFFVTFRLAGSLSREVVRALKEQSEREKRALSSVENLEERQEQLYQHNIRVFDHWDDALASSKSDPQWLANPDVASLVTDALYYRDGMEYDLWAFCVMPNHVHLVCTPLEDEGEIPRPLPRILQSLKRYTARKANQVLERHGAFWQAESYDHVIRDAEEFIRVLWFVVNNPVQAGLTEAWDAWPWTYVKSQVGMAFRPTLKPLLTRLYPLHRTLASDGTDEALRILGEQIPPVAKYALETYAPGTPVWTWTVPERYVVHEAYLETEDGRRVVDFADNPLHIVSYSLPVDKLLSWDELEPYLYYSEKRPWAVPWIFKYYERSWGFCLPKETFDQLPRDQRYRAVIRSEFLTDPGNGFRIGVGVVHPEGGPSPEAGEILVSSHICHPMQANDDLAGVVTAIEVARRLAENPLPAGSMSVRFWFGPETIGTIAYLAHHEDLIPQLKGGIFVEMTGNRNPIAVHRSRQENHLLDRVADYALRATHHVTRPFAAAPANDERVINGPGVNVPCISVNRWPYDEYHTSDDSPDIIHEDMLQGAADVIEEVIRIYATNYIPRRTFRGPVFLSGHGLWVDWRENWELNRAIEKIMMRFEGQHSLFDIAEEVNLNYWVVRDYVEKFRAKGLVRALPIPSEAPEN